MTRNLLVFICTIVSLHFSYAQKGTVEGKLINGNLNSIYYSYIDLSGKTINDSTSIINNTFKINLKISEPTRLLLVDTKNYHLINNENNVDVFVYPENTELNLNATNFKDYNIKPLRLNDLHIKYHKQYLRNVGDKMNALAKKFTEAKSESERKEMLMEFENLQRLNFLNKYNFGYQNPSYYTLFLLDQMLQEPESANYDKELEVLFNDQKPEQSTNLSLKLENKLRILKMNAIGSPAFDVDLIDINGKNVKLSNIYRGKLLLLEYWASWCIPCRNELPELKKIKKQFGNQLEIISVSIDENSKSWRKAVSEDQMYDWINVLLKDQTTKDITFKYNVTSAIPVKILISKEGKIIGRWSGGENLNETENIIKSYLGK